MALLVVVVLFDHAALLGREGPLERRMVRVVRQLFVRQHGEQGGLDAGAAGGGREALEQRALQVGLSLDRLAAGGDEEGVEVLHVAQVFDAEAVELLADRGHVDSVDGRLVRSGGVDVELGEALQVINEVSVAHDAPPHAPAGPTTNWPKMAARSI
ncbi:MAG TPA: hypothetical protein VFS43_17100 [Polyangiaceae bacterium]|nr:hypothetical protein [Polyangiaceae bacterium]